MGAVIPIWILFGIASVIVSSQKGRSGCAWFAMGFLLGPFGLLFALLVSSQKNPAPQSNIQQPNEPVKILDNYDTKKCPQCAEIIKLEALKCRYCGEVFTQEEVDKAIEDSWRIRDEDYNDPHFCPRCRRKDVILGAVLPEGGIGSYCPHCKQSIK